MNVSGSEPRFHCSELHCTVLFMGRLGRESTMCSTKDAFNPYNKIIKMLTVLLALELLEEGLHHVVRGCLLFGGERVAA